MTELLSIFSLIVISVINSVFCQTLKTDETLGQQLNQTYWPGGQLDPINLPNSKWNASLWPGSSYVSTAKPGVSNKATKYPPLPNFTWPSLKPVTRPSIPPQPILEPVEITPTEDTTQKTMTPSKAPSTPKPVTSRPTTRPPPPQTRPPPVQIPGPSDDSSKITVKNCGLSHIPQVFIGNKIVMGKVAKGGEFPWQVILKIHTAKGAMQCGGSILNSRWILTAAHCVSNERNGQPTAQRVDVTAGVHNRLVVSAGSQQRISDCVIQHEGWSGQTGKFRNDIALLRIPADKPIDINYDKGGNINGICLPPKPNSEFSGKARISGWGLTKDKGSPSEVLLYTDVSIIANSECRKYQYPVEIADSMMCQGVDRTAPCQGDSGGPLVMSFSDSRGVQRMTEVGIVSFGPGQCANPTTPNAVYTKTSYFLKWIEKTINANQSKCNARALQTDDNEKLNETNESSTNSTVIDSGEPVF